MNRKTFSVALIFTALLFASCKAPETKTEVTPPGVKKELSKSHDGKAVITEITAAGENSGGDIRGYMEIYFDFIPSVAEGEKGYLCAACPGKRIKLFYDNRESFHKNWVNRWDIKPGNGYRAIRHEIVRSDGTPVITYEVFLEPK